MLRKIVRLSTPSLSIITILSTTILIVVLSCGCINHKQQNIIENYIDGSIMVDGIERTYHLYIPNNYNPNAHLPLLIVLHGGGGNGKGMEEKTTLGEFDKLADKENFIVVYPDAFKKHWNDGKEDPYSYSARHNIDDVKFISTLIDYLGKKYNIDKNRVYVVGMSNGGMMSFRLACELSDKIAGIATVAASMPENLYILCHPSNKISILMIHGTHDPIVPWEGGYVHIFGKRRGNVVSIEESFEFWARHNNCTLQFNQTYLPDIDPNDGTKVWKKECSNEENGTKVILYGIEGGGHTWPGGLRRFSEQIVGRISHDINACKVIWNFFKEIRINS